MNKSKNRLRHNKSLYNILLLIIILFSPAYMLGFSLQTWTETIDKISATDAANKNNHYKFSDEYRLIFVYKSTCKYCHRFAPVLYQYKDRYEIVSLTADGGTIAPFTEPVYDQNLLLKLGATSYPTLFAMKKDGGNLILINEGALNSQELDTRINTVLTELYGDSLRVGS